MMENLKKKRETADYFAAKLSNTFESTMPVCIAS